MPAGYREPRDQAEPDRLLGLRTYNNRKRPGMIGP